MLCTMCIGDSRLYMYFSCASVSLPPPPSTPSLQCDASESTWQLINAIVLNADRAQPKIMFLGGGCSPATEPLAALSGRFYNVTQVSSSIHCNIQSLSLYPVESEWNWVKGKGLVPRLVHVHVYNYCTCTCGIVRLAYGVHVHCR